MSSKKWLFMFIGTVLLLALLVAAFNFIMDPFGAFGDGVFEWWSYDMTNNPRVAKFSYLEKYHEKYDSYIIGASGSSSFPVESLNEQFGGSFYNLTMYGSDMLDVQQTAEYLINNYTVKNLVLSVYIQNAEKYAQESDPLTHSMHYKADGSSALKYYLKFLFVNPRYSLDKLTRHFSQGYLQTAYKVYDTETGTYDKSVRDVENIGALSEYLSREEYSAFNDYPKFKGELPYIDECMDSLKQIRDLCKERGITLTVICPTMYHEFMECFTDEDIMTFRKRLADVTDYWDFTVNYASFDARFFYDTTHFRNAIGKLAIEQIGGKANSIGMFVKKGQSEFEPYIKSAPDITYTKDVPILMYHNIVNNIEEDKDAVSAASLENQLSALASAGYTTVTFDDLREYVLYGAKIPEKPIVITFDDGYKSNFDIAYPILRRFGMRATVFAIGISAGKDIYKDGKPMTPHFSIEDIDKVSDVFSVQSHGYDIHEVEGRDKSPIRRGILRKKGESEQEYIRFLREDNQKMAQVLGYKPGVLAYPYGLHDQLSDVILNEEGIFATVTTEPGVNTIIRNLPQSLQAMLRFDMSDDITEDSLIKMIKASD